MAKQRVGTTIEARVEGVQQAELELKAVVYVEEKEEIKILAEAPVDEEAFKLTLDRGAEEFPEKAELAIVPREVEARSHIKRLSDAGYAPRATISRDLVIARDGAVGPRDLRLKPVDDLGFIWPWRRRVCGRVFKIDPETGEECPVPGATVRVLDVDLHLFWWYPYPGFPWCWLFPYWPRRREEIATTTTDECGNFCVDLPLFDIDAVLRWRLRYRCLWETLRPPRVIDAIELGVRPDPRIYEELELLPEMEPRPGPRPGPEPGPILRGMSPRGTQRFRSLKAVTPSREASQASAGAASDFYTSPRFQLVRDALFGKQTLFEPVEPEERSLLERPAFPRPIAPPALPDDEKLDQILPDKEMLEGIRQAQPLVRLLHCWPEMVPEWHLFLDIPDIVFKVEQDVDSDGVLETIYDEGYFDVNWNMGEPTSDIEIEAWSNAICVPCGPSYTPCTDTGIVGLTDLPAEPPYLNAAGYATTVNRPKPNGIRPDAETPFCKTLRVVGCPDYGNAAYYKLFYSYNGGPQTHFTEEWYVYRISTDTTIHVTPDAGGFYEVLEPPSDYFPYHTLMNWRTHRYPNGQYELELKLYDSGQTEISSGIDTVNVMVDNSRPNPVAFKSLAWRVAGAGAWNTVPLHCPIIKRPAMADIELRVQYNVAATHLRSLGISFQGCDGQVGSDSYWHHHVGDNNQLRTWTVTMPGTKDEGAYRFHLVGRSRAYDGAGGLATGWEFDPVDIARRNSLYVAILDD